MLWGSDDPPEWLEASRTSPLLKISSRLIVDFVEERREAARTDDDSPAKEEKRTEKKPRTSPDRREEDRGYKPGERQRLEGLTDADKIGRASCGDSECAYM